MRALEEMLIDLQTEEMLNAREDFLGLVLGSLVLAGVSPWM